MDPIDEGRLAHIGAPDDGHDRSSRLPRHRRRRPRRRAREGQGPRRRGRIVEPCAQWVQPPGTSSAAVSSSNFGWTWSAFIPPLSQVCRVARPLGWSQGPDHRTPRDVPSSRYATCLGHARPGRASPCSPARWSRQPDAVGRLEDTGAPKSTTSWLRHARPGVMCSPVASRPGRWWDDRGAAVDREPRSPSRPRQGLPAPPAFGKDADDAITPQHLDGLSERRAIPDLLVEGIWPEARQQQPATVSKVSVSTEEVGRSHGLIEATRAPSR